MARNLYADMGVGMNPNNQTTAKQLKNQSMVGGLINAGIGLGESAYNTNLANQNAASNEAIFNQQIAAARPGSTTGSAYGDAIYNQDTNTINYTPNESMQGMLGSLYSQQQALQNQVSDLNPYSLGQQMYDLKRPAMQLAQDRQTNQALERLTAQGMLTSSHGNQLQGGLAQNQYMANQQALSEDILNAQNMKTANFQQQQITGGLIDNINTGQLNQMGQNIAMGANVSPSDRIGESYQNIAATKQKQGSGIADILGIAGGAIGGPVGGAIGSFVGGLFS
tara:strand:- start:36 stop:875 length:840 start_codon:yes stop_codon:yes gene_type:complete